MTGECGNDKRPCVPGGEATSREESCPFFPQSQLDVTRISIACGHHTSNPNWFSFGTHRSMAEEGDNVEDNDDIGSFGLEEDLLIDMDTNNEGEASEPKQGTGKEKVPPGTNSHDGSSNVIGGGTLSKRTSDKETLPVKNLPVPVGCRFNPVSTNLLNLFTGKKGAIPGVQQVLHMDLTSTFKASVCKQVEESAEQNTLNMLSMSQGPWRRQADSTPTQSGWGSSEGEQPTQGTSQSSSRDSWSRQKKSTQTWSGWGSSEGEQPPEGISQSSKIDSWSRQKDSTPMQPGWGSSKGERPPQGTSQSSSRGPWGRQNDSNSTWSRWGSSKGEWSPQGISQSSSHGPWRRQNNSNSMRSGWGRGHASSSDSASDSVSNSRNLAWGNSDRRNEGSSHGGSSHQESGSFTSHSDGQQWHNEVQASSSSSSHGYWRHSTGGACKDSHPYHNHHSQKQLQVQDVQFSGETPRKVSWSAKAGKSSSASSTPTARWDRK